MNGLQLWLLTSSMSTSHQIASKTSDKPKFFWHCERIKMLRRMHPKQFKATVSKFIAMSLVTLSLRSYVFASVIYKAPNQDGHRADLFSDQLLPFPATFTGSPDADFKSWCRQVKVPPSCNFFMAPCSKIYPCITDPREFPLAHARRVCIC